MTIFAIDKKLTSQDFDTVAVLNKLPEMVAVLVKLAERLEGRQLPLVVFPGDSLGNQILEAVEGISDTGESQLNRESEVTETIDQGWQVTLCSVADRVGDGNEEPAYLDCWLQAGEDVTSSFRVVYCTEAQLNLIAAAPDLLDALKGLLSVNVRVHDLTENDVHSITKAKAIIAKAEGK